MVMSAWPGIRGGIIEGTWGGWSVSNELYCGETPQAKGRQKKWRWPSDRRIGWSEPDHRRSKLPLLPPPPPPSYMATPRKQSDTLLSPSAPAPHRERTKRKPSHRSRGRTCSDVPGLELLGRDGGAAGRRHCDYLLLGTQETKRECGKPATRTGSGSGWVGGLVGCCEG